VSGSEVQLVWFRQDLRLADQPAVAAAAAAGPVVGLYVLDDDTPGDWKIGGAQRWWLHHSLESLGRSIAARGSMLVLRRGRSADVVPAVAQEVGAAAVHATRHVEPWWREAEQQLGGLLRLHPEGGLAELDALRTGAGERFTVFGPFFRALSAHLPPPRPRAPPPASEPPDTAPRSDSLGEWNLLPTRPNWAIDFDIWQPGEEGASATLARFADRADNYAEQRDLPSIEGTSSLSPYLHHGEISRRQVWHALGGAGGDKFRRELAWRDFSRSVVLGFPELGERPQRPGGRSPRSGADADRDFAAWSRGRTGYPIVDAGMRQLWSIGWMHNRARLVTASFLVKHLLLPWQRGARWFWDTLVDADYANNSQNWQWIAGSGFDSQPFYRIMAPLLQSAKFDAAGYIRRWVPELAALPDDDIHDPWGRGVAPAGYPEPLIGHKEGRERALADLRRKG
jgi:deoxyribodipyrimidine photo-lyase